MLRVFHIGSLWHSLFAIGMICALPPKSASQTQPPEQKTFKSPDSSFEFTYPSSHNLFTGDQAASAGRNLSYIAVCENALACVVYPKDEYKETNFGAASFQVLQIEEAETANACLTSPMRSEDVPEFKVDSSKPKRSINGVTFLHATRGDAGLGHFMDTDLYRAFHNGRCYELSINIAATSFANFDPGTVKEFTTRDAERINADLMRILDSFRFLK